jgi:type III pantothenate kinase
LIAMLLAVDVGNTNTKFAVHDGKEWRGQWRASTDATRTADEYAPWLAQWLAFQDLRLADISACIISTVVPQALFNLRNLSRRYLNTEPMVIGEDGLDLGMALRIDNPREAGADRLVNAVGAFVAYGGPSIVIDSGTATTFDLVAGDGGLEGVIIAPGINLSLQALHDAAARLPRIEIKEPPNGALGKNTVHAMQSGVFYGYIELIDGLVRRLKREQEPRLGGPFKVVATGGVASLFEHASTTIGIFDHELTSKGLLEVFRRNGGKI